MTDDVFVQFKALISEPGWTPLASTELTIFIHPWPDGSTDTLAIRHEQDAMAERTNAAGQPVWREKGDLGVVLAALRAVPAPDAADAPSSVLARVDTPDRDI